MSRISNLHQIAISQAPAPAPSPGPSPSPEPSPPGTSALAKAAAAMAPGSWKKMTTTTGQNSVLGSQSGATGSLIPYCNSMPWNKQTKRIDIVARDHDGGSYRHVCYDEEGDLFLTVDANAMGGNGHGYDHTVVNPVTGDIYHLVGDGTSRTVRKIKGASAFGALPSGPGGFFQNAIGTCWWSGSLTGAGAQGAFLIFNSGNATNKPTDGMMVGFDPVASRWFLNKTGMAPNYGTSTATYHSVCEYSTKKNVAVYGGGNAAPTKLWKMDSGTNMVVMPVLPSGMKVGMQNGLLCEEPVTGNFLLLSGGSSAPPNPAQLWMLNPDGTGTWTKCNAQPPVEVGNPSGSQSSDGMICTPLPDHGVVAYIKQTSASGGTFWLYKHA